MWTNGSGRRSKRGEIVLADRFTDSSLVYQGYGRNLGAENVLALDRIACRGLKPDLTLLLDIDAETSLARAHARNAAETSTETRMDEQSPEFHRKVSRPSRIAASEPAGEDYSRERAAGRGETEQAIWKTERVMFENFFGNAAAAKALE